jgi:hypothetical protein
MSGVRVSIRMFGTMNFSCLLADSHLATKRSRQYTTLSIVVICCNDLMTAVRPSDGRSPNDNEAHMREV